MGFVFFLKILEAKVLNLTKSVEIKQLISQ